MSGIVGADMLVNARWHRAQFRAMAIEHRLWCEYRDALTTAGDWYAGIKRQQRVREHASYGQVEKAAYVELCRLGGIDP